MSNVREFGHAARTGLPQTGFCGKAVSSLLLAGVADIAVHLDGSSREESKILYAEALAVAAGAHLTAFMTNEIVLSPIAGHPGSSWIVAEVLKQVRSRGDEIEERLRQRLTRLEPATDLRRSDAGSGELMAGAARLARICDLFVCGRPYGEERHWPEIVEAVLFEESAPVLVVPPDHVAGALPKTILVGWRDTGECAHAITAALPFLKAADTVHLACIAEGASEEERHREPAADMAKHLARHGVNVEIRHLPHWDRAGEGLINEAKLLGADLVVAGAYGHTRVREWILGGATRDLLTDSPVPVLLGR